MLPKAIYRFKVSPTNSKSIFYRNQPNSSKMCMDPQKTQTAERVLRKKKNWRHYVLWLKSILKAIVKSKQLILLTMLKPLTVWITTNCGKFLKRWEYQTTWPASWEICTQIKEQQLELNMEHWTGSKLGQQYIKAVYCHPAYLPYMKSTSCKMPSWIKHKLESRLPGEISITSDTQMTPPLWQKVKKN